MKKTFYQLLLPLLLLTSWAARGQTTLQQESFEVAPGTGSSKVDVANSQFYTTATTGSGNEYFVRTSNATLATDAAGFSPTTGVSGGTLNGSFYVAGEGVRGPSTGPTRTNPGTITLVSQSTTGYSGLKVVVALASTRADGIGRMEADDALRVQVRFDGAGSWITIGQFFGDNTVGGNQGLWRQDVGLDGSSADDAAASGPFMGTSLSDFTFNVIGSPVSAMQTRIVVDEYGTSEEFAIDNIRVTGVVGTNQAPVLANIEGSALPYAESNPTTSVTITSTITVSDADNTTLTGGTVRFTAGFNSTEDQLNFVNQNGISGSYNTGTGVLTLSGSATLAAYQAALRSVKYQDTDAFDAQAGTRTVSFVVTDGVGTSLAVTRDITVTSALDAASTLPYTEDLTTDGEGTRYSSNHFASTDGSGTAFFRTNLATNANGQFNQNGFTAPTFTNISNSWYWYGAGVSNSKPTGYFITKQLNAASYANLVFQVRLGATSGVWDNNDQTRFYYRVNNGTWVLFGSFRSTDQSSNNGNGNMAQDVNPANLASPPTGTVLSPALQNITFNLPSALNGQQVDFKIEENNDSGTGAGEVFAFDLIQVSGTLLTPPTVTTAAATSITTASAVLGGNVTADGGDAVTGRGVVYSATNTTPAIAGTGVTQDANGTGTGTFSKTISGLTPGTTYYVRAYATNGAGTSYGAVQSFTTTPNAPVVTAPANGSLINTTAPNYTGTAQAGSTVTVYVDGTSIGTTTATGGTFSLAQPTALSQGSHTVYATAAISGSAQSANSATNTFTVDSVQPTVAITSGAAANGGTTTASPIPFTVTFSENVTGFVAGDVTVTNGTITGGTVNGTSPGTTYTFTVTPTTAGTATTVTVPANVAQDAAGNQNTAGTPAPYSITYNIPSTTVSSVTRLNPSPTATAQVSYRVSFAASVTGVTVSNFTLNTTGTVSGASVSSASGSGTTYTVVVNTGTGSGTLRLDVANSTGITPTVSNVPYTAGETYTITKSFAAAPQLTIVGTGGTGSDVTAFVDTVRVLSGGSAFAKALRNGSFEYHGALANGDFGYNPAGASWTFNAQAGIAESGSAFTPVTPIPNGIAVAFVQSNGSGNGQLQQNLAVPTGSNYQVSFQAAQRVCCTTRDQSLNVFLNGVYFGNIQPIDGNGYSTFTSPAFSVTAPALTATVSTTSASPTSTAPIPFSVSFSQSVGTTFTASDVTVTGGTITGGSFSGSGSGPYTFTVTPSGTGTVTVSLAANVANDANNTQNSASNSVSVQYVQPVTAAPVVTAPANGSLINTATPAYSGTAPANSTVTVYVDGSAIGTTTADGTGNFSLTQPTTLAQGSHTVYATAQTTGSTVSANSNTNTFTVDSVRPTVAISSTAGASGSTTNTSPIPFTVTFSEAVTGFVSGDLTVTNGTTSGFSGTGTTYTFNMTPTTAGTATTVNVPAAVAQDAAGNFNMAAPSVYSITYVQLVTAAPVVTAPANGSLINTTTPAYSGTAVANSTVTVSVDGTSIGTTTADGTGNFTLTQPTALAQGSHTVRATAQSTGSAVSANSNTNTFTVDSVRPSVAISSTAGATGSTTTTTPISFTVTFSEAVTGFVAGDVTVTNGSISGFSGSGTTYTFNVTPTTAGTATTVNVPANVAVDAAGNGNTGAPSIYSLTYLPTAVTWNGSISGDWFTAGNWTPAVVPTTAIDASIPASAPNMPAIAAGTASVKALTINSGATVSQTGGTLDVRANLTNNGTFTATGGTVVLGTSTLASILGSSNTRFWNLTVNASGAQSSTSASTSVQRLFTLNGTFTTNGNPLTMESNATNTALLVNNGSNVIAGNVTVQRYIAPDLNPGLGYRHYSAPVSTATVGSLTTASFTPVVNPAYNTSNTPNSVRPFPTVYYYDQSRLATSTNLLAPFDKGWTSPNALSDPLTVGRGYTVNLTAGQTLAVTGPQNNGTVSQTLARTTAFPIDAGWQLLGNPYPSPLDYSLVAPFDRLGLDAALYVFESTSLYGGTYRANVNGVGGNANSPNAILAQGQGFFVRVSNGQTIGQLILRNSHRVTAYQNPVYHRTVETRPLVQLDLQGASQADPLYVYFENGATAGVDQEMDAVKLPNSTGLNLAAWTGNDKLAINALPLTSTASVTVPLFIGLPVTGTYTLHAAQVLNFGAGEQPFLRDLQLGTLTDLSLHPDYTFTMNAANTTTRFELVFGARVLGVASAKLAAQVAVYPNPASKAVFVELPYALNRKAVTAALVDALGRVVLTQALPAGQPTYTLPLTNLATGVYSLRLQTEAGVVVKKLVVE